jgi:hypothetical protein
MPSELGPILDHVIQQAIRTIWRDTPGLFANLPKEAEPMTKALYYHTIATILNTEDQQPHCTWYATAHGVQWQREESLRVVEYDTYDIPFPLQGDTL